MGGNLQIGSWVDFRNIIQELKLEWFSPIFLHFIPWISMKYKPGSPWMDSLTMIHTSICKWGCILGSYFFFLMCRVFVICTLVFLRGFTDRPRRPDFLTHAYTFSYTCFKYWMICLFFFENRFVSVQKNIVWLCLTRPVCSLLYSKLYCLVVWNIFYFFICWE